MNDVALLIVAAGVGKRLGGSSEPKALRMLSGEPLLWHAVQRGLASGHVGALVVATPEIAVDQSREVVERACVGTRVWRRVVAGGAHRTGSVFAALTELTNQAEFITQDETIVVVHDAARPLAPSSLFRDVIAAVRAGAPAVIPGIPVTDTIKSVDDDSTVVTTPERRTLRAVQTPQGFQLGVLTKAHVVANTHAATDDAALVENLGTTVTVIPGDQRAMKITHPVDLQLAKLLAANEEVENL